MKNDFKQWKDDYGLEFEPNYSKETELDCMAAFKAGQQSKQAEVDELRFQRDVLSNKVDELQKRIDLALEYIEPSDNINHKAYRDLYKILKGEETK